MNYLESAISLVELTKESNRFLLDATKDSLDATEYLRIQEADGGAHSIEMGAYTNEFVTDTLADFAPTRAFVMTSLATKDVRGRQLTYLLYKGYHAGMENGLVFFQVIGKDTRRPIGNLQFSNMEENPFYPIETHQIEECSCNAMETGSTSSSPNHKSIVFFIGHMDEKRLLYDIQRLIFDTVNNVSRHEKLHFSFVINIARFGKLPSRNLREQVAAIDVCTQRVVVPAYPNTLFKFQFECDE